MSKIQKNIFRIVFLKVLSVSILFMGCTGTIRSQNLTLPYEGTVNNGNTAFTIKNIGIGGNGITGFARGGKDSWALCGVNTSSFGIGVKGEARGNGDQKNYGGYFQARGKNGIGVFGIASSQTEGSYNFGGHFISFGQIGRGVSAEANGESGYGVYSTASGKQGRAVCGYAENNGDCHNYGGYFQAWGKNGTGVYGMASNDGGGSNRGGDFIAKGKDGTGVYGTASNDGDCRNYGGIFEAFGKYGCGIRAAGGPEGYAADFVGTIRTGIVEIIGGSDLSERFEIRTDEGVLPTSGMVVSIDPQNPGNLAICTKAYDQRVAGIISGAGNISSGMIMSQTDSVTGGEYPVALTGRIYCLVDASFGPIEPGDLLTTSDTPGHAMKVTDYIKANGAIIGKAMSELEDGQGLVLVLVSLQ